MVLANGTIPEIGNAKGWFGFDPCRGQSSVGGEGDHGFPKCSIPNLRILSVVRGKLIFVDGRKEWIYYG
jgi:hypothetical protein